MKRILAVAGAMLLSVATPAFAHRLDEYLQATTILVGNDRVHVDMRLTPGVAVLPAVLKLLDADGDGAISDAEQRVYAEQVVGDLALTADGERLSLRLVSSSAGTVEEMQKGLREIHLALEADLPNDDVGDRNLRFENHHLGRISVYMVNGLVPQEPDLHIASQRRDSLQSWYEMSYVNGTGARSVSFSSLLRWVLMGVGAMVLVGQLAFEKRRRLSTARA